MNQGNGGRGGILINIGISGKADPANSTVLRVPSRGTGRRRPREIGRGPEAAPHPPPARPRFAIDRGGLIALMPMGQRGIGDLDADILSFHACIS
jgi:hypothetical protein